MYNNSIAYVKDKMVCTVFTTMYTAPLGHNESVQKKKILNLSDILDAKITHLSLLIHQLSGNCKYISYYISNEY